MSELRPLLERLHAYVAGGDPTTERALLLHRLELALDHQLEARERRVELLEAENENLRWLLSVMVEAADASREAVQAQLRASEMAQAVLGLTTEPSRPTLSAPAGSRKETEHD